MQSCFVRWERSVQMGLNGPGTVSRRVDYLKFVDFNEFSKEADCIVFY